MTAPIQVVLQEAVGKLGKAGDVVRVRPGFARNYLVPRGIAVFATHGNVKRIEHERKVALQRAAKSRADAEGVAAALSEIELQIAKSAGEGGKLFGSVTSAEIAEELQKKGYEVDKRKVAMPSESIKETGEYVVQIKLAPEVSAELKVQVTAAE